MHLPLLGVAFVLLVRLLRGGNVGCARMAMRARRAAAMACRGVVVGGGGAARPAPQATVSAPERADDGEAGVGLAHALPPPSTECAAAGHRVRFWQSRRRAATTVPLPPRRLFA